MIAAIAEELSEADRERRGIPRITARYPEATVEDSQAIQEVWRDGRLAAGRRLVGRTAPDVPGRGTMVVSTRPLH